MVCRGGSDYSRLPTAPPTVELERSGAEEPIGLEPVEAVTITTLVDNVVDVLLPDAGPAPTPASGS